MYLYLDFHSEYVYLADIAEIHLLPNHSQEMYSIPFPHKEDTWDQFWEISFESNSIFLTKSAGDFFLSSAL